MIKRIAAVFTALMMVASSVEAFSDVDMASDLGEAVETLSLLRILDGMEDGSFRPDEFVTREQFAKIVTCILGQRDSVSLKASAAAFTDVDSDSWAGGYISYAAENGIISGFPDGSFGGKNNITYAQAAAILLRCLGYSDEEIGYHWPKDYISKAEAVGINKGVYLTADEDVHRSDAALMIYNAVFADLNGSSEKLVTKTGMKVYDDAVLYGVSKTDASSIETSEGSFKLSDDAIGISEGYGKSGMLLLDKDEKAVIFKASGQEGREIIITASLVSTEKESVDVSFSDGTVSIPLSGTVYSDGKKITAKEAAEDMTIGSRMTLYYDINGAFLSAVLYSQKMDGPKTVTRDASQIYELFDIEGEPKVIRKGVAASLGDISRYDVVYYEKNTNTVYAYANTAGGIYEKAEPLKSAVSEVTVSGKKYKISSTNAAEKLNESPGAFAIGDYVTLLLDKNGEVCDVVDASTMAGRSLGVVLKSYSRINESGNQEYAVKMFLPSGDETEFAADRDYTEYKGKLVEMKFQNGIITLKTVKYSSMSGTINKEMLSFDNLWLASDCSVLVLVSNSSDEAVVKKIRFGDISGTTLSKSQVLHVEQSGEMNDITLLYLKDVTYDEYEYGIITKEEKIVIRNENGETVKQVTLGYKLTLHGEIIDIDAGNRLFTSMVIGVNQAESGDYVDTVVMGSGREISAVSGERIKVGGTVYRTAEKYDIYKRSTSGYTLISSEEAIKIKGSVELYGDAMSEKGGKVRLVIVSE